MTSSTKDPGSAYLTVTLPSGLTFYITSYQERDIPAAQAALTIPSIVNHLISIPVPYTMEHATAWVTQQMATSTTSTTLPLQVIRTEDAQNGPLIGCVSLTPTPTRDSPTAEIGYYLLPEYRGLGIMRPATEALVDWARKEMGITSFFIRVVESNVGSRRIAEALKGFELDEEATEWEVWPEVKGGGRRKLLRWASR